MAIPNPQRFSIDLCGRTLTLETGRLAQLAGASVLATYGETMVLAAATSSNTLREGIDFFPLTIDYEERMYAAGKIPGGFIKREGRPSEAAILNARLTDRPLRPLFPHDYRNDTQIVITVLSVDQQNDPGILGIIAASAALSISDVPFYGPVGAVSVGYINDELVINPTLSELPNSRLNLSIAGTADAVMMVEAGAIELPEETMLAAIEAGHDALKQIVELQDRMVKELGKPKRSYTIPEKNVALNEAVAAWIGDRLNAAVFNADKDARESGVAALRSAVIDEFVALGHASKEIGQIYDSMEAETVRSAILDRSIRPDGRVLDEIRTITTEVGILPRVHGSALFTRGQTQLLSVCTLGTVGDEQIIDGIGVEESKRFIHHYNFPPFSVGEVRRMVGPSRRDIGHGHLIERSLLAVIPEEAEFPYTIRLVAETLASNGSSSMGSVCAGTMALMDAGVPIRAPVAGIAMGLITRESDHAYKILTDIQGVEDHLGDMDFKVAGTAQGVCGLQMDIKVRGITPQIMREAMTQAREGRMFILGKLKETISASRTELSPFAPRITKIKINPDRIRDIIGPGGKMIRKITEETKCTIDIEDDGTVLVGSTSAENAQHAIEIINGLTRDVEVGSVYTGKVTRVMAFGAFVETLPGKEGLVHISELADYRVGSVEDIVQIGDEVTVLVTEIDRQGRINLSRRALLAPSDEVGAGAPRPAPVAAPAGGPGRPMPNDNGGNGRPPYGDGPRNGNGFRGGERPAQRSDRPPFRGPGGSGPRPSGPRPVPGPNRGPARDE